jgi:hypothetical protein
VTVTVVLRSDRPLPEPTEVMRCAANATKSLGFRTPEKLYVYETILEGLAQHLQDMAAELGPFIQEAHAVMGQRHLAGHRYVAATEQPRWSGGARDTGGW